MRKFEVNGDRFSVEADVEQVLKDHGPGVYQVILFAVVEGEVEPISEYPIFHEIPRPTEYD